MEIIDLTHEICEDIPVYPGTEKPKLKKANTIEKDGFRETKFVIYSHIGTHMDAPYHMKEKGYSLDKFNVDKFIENAFVIDISNINSKKIDLNYIKDFEKEIAVSQFILFYSSWSDRWGKQSYFNDFPVLTEETAKWLCKFDLKGIGIDMISVDTIDTLEFPVHKILFNNDIVIIENLVNIDKLINKKFIFSAMPLKVIEADGSPVRAIGIKLPIECK